MNKLSFKTNKFAFLLTLVALLCFPATAAFSQGGGPPPPGGGGGGGGGGGATGTGDGHFVFSTKYQHDGNINSQAEHDFFNTMEYTKTVKTGNCHITYEVKVLDKANKLTLEPDELVDVEFTATLDWKLVPLDPIAYHFFMDGFELVSSTNGDNVFPGVGSSFSGTAQLKFKGASLSSTGKHYFGIENAGPVIGDGHVRTVWCSQSSPEPIMQCEPDCDAACGFSTNLASGST